MTLSAQLWVGYNTY